MKTHPYFEEKLQQRPEVRREWCERVVANPLKVVRQDNGRVSFWATIPEFGDRVLRVITLEDGETLFNAYFDRNFYAKLRRGLEL